MFGMQENNRIGTILTKIVNSYETKHIYHYDTVNTILRNGHPVPNIHIDTFKIGKFHDPSY